MLENQLETGSNVSSYYEEIKKAEDELDALTDQLGELVKRTVAGDKVEKSEIEGIDNRMENARRRYQSAYEVLKNNL